mmetsp:Transcript_13247/g.23325  ORF Transcript_13247/g.23325 Transcript_13247/m.23325 type:complete len:367 (-) Transcript_13247:402-1502(-)
MLRARCLRTPPGPHDGYMAHTWVRYRRVNPACTGMAMLHNHNRCQPRMNRASPENNLMPSQQPSSIPPHTDTPIDSQQPTSSTTLPHTDSQETAPDSQEPQLWWVERFEARRAAAAAAAATPKSPAATPTTRPGLLATVTQYGQLTVVLGALLFLPVIVLQPGGIYNWRLFTVYFTYWLFFSASVRRQLRFGALVKRPLDKQTGTWADTARLVAFIAALVLLHMLAVLRSGVSEFHVDTWYEVLSFPTVCAALWLHDKATKELGPAWDRVVAPARLVTTGVYSLAQHPIYTSYTLLFMGSALFLHSAPVALMMLAICALHYRRRAELESAVLKDQFGEEYAAYVAHTSPFLPSLLRPPGATSSVPS